MDFYPCPLSIGSDMALFTVALTGGIASGKSTVGGMLEEKGACLLDSDVMAREVVRKGTVGWREIVDHFGRDILEEDGELDRSKLADIVFKDAEERSFLNGVTHPRIFQLMAESIRDIEAETGGEGVVVLDIPLLVEAKAGKIFDFTLVVDASPQVQAKRLMRDRKSSEEQAWSRIKSQVSREERLKIADCVIHNDGDMDELRREVGKAWDEIRKRAGLP
jgi:dephospho-CoA kinase